MQEFRIFFLLVLSVLAPTGMVKAYECPVIYSDKVLRDLDTYHYMTGVLALTAEGRVALAVGSVADGHTRLIETIEQDDGKVTELLWAGELSGNSNGFQEVNETAGILKPNAPMPSYRVNAHVDNLRAFVRDNPSVAEFFSRADYQTFAEHPEHLHPDLDKLSDYRHQIRQFFSAISMARSMLRGNPADEYIKTLFVGAATELLTIFITLQSFHIPIAELGEWVSSTQRMIELKGASSEEAFEQFMSIRRKIESLAVTPVVTTIH